jgi:hypothetical protein
VDDDEVLRGPGAGDVLGTRHRDVDGPSRGRARSAGSRGDLTGRRRPPSRFRRGSGRGRRWLLRMLAKAGAVAGTETILTLYWVATLRGVVPTPPFKQAMEAPPLQPGWRRRPLPRIEAELP